MATPKKIVYADTNAIIEATRTGCLKGILNLYDVRTVEEVRKESLHVPKDQKSFVKVDEALFRSQINVSPVKEADILRAAVKAPGLMALDKGERDLRAQVLNNAAVINRTGLLWEVLPERGITARHRRESQGRAWDDPSLSAGHDRERQRGGGEF